MRRGIAAARVGESDEARELLREVTQRDPDNADAWLWLAGVRSEPRAKRQAFDRVLELDPGNEDAEDGLERLAEKYGRGVLDDEDEAEVIYCTWHPSRETLLRCNRCDRPMCPDCARQHPVGLRCKQCAKELRSPLYRVSVAGYFAAGALATVVGALSAALTVGILSFTGGFFGIILGFLLGSSLGSGVAEAASRGAGGKRGRGLQIVAGVGLAAGTVIAVAFASTLGFRALDIGLLVFVLSGVSAAVTRLR